MVYVPVDDSVKASDLVVDIQRTRLTIGVKGQEPVLDGELWKEIRGGESDWVLDYEGKQKCVIATLIKRDVWIDYMYLLKSHEQADKPTITEKCFVDVSIDGQAAGRLVVGLYGQAMPQSTQTFRRLCTGEQGDGLCYQGKTFDYILPDHSCHICAVEEKGAGRGDDMTADSSSAEESSTEKGESEEHEKDEEGEGDEEEEDDEPTMESSNILHSRPGLLSMSKLGSDLSEFCITLGEAPDLNDTNNVVGEVLEDDAGVLEAMASRGDPDNSGEVRGVISIEACGLLTEQ